MAARGDAIAVVEACYDLHADDDAWLRGIAQALQDVVKPSHGMLAYHADLSERGVRLSSPLFVGEDVERGAKIAAQQERLVVSLERRREGRKLNFRDRLVAVAYEKTITAALNESVERIALSELATVGPRWIYTLGTPGVVDLFWYANHHVDGNGVTAFVGGLDRKATFHQSDRQRCLMLSAHIKAGFRLRRKLGPERQDGVVAPEGGAVLDANARVIHAEGEATEQSAADELRARARHIDTARSRKHGRGEDPLEVWQGLVEGRWSLVEQFDSDGRRFLLAHRNPENVPDPRGLTTIETRVVGLVVRGYADKLVAYHLGIPVGTVSYHLARAMRKLRLNDRTELVRLLGRSFPQPHR